MLYRLARCRPWVAEEEAAEAEEPQLALGLVLALVQQGPVHWRVAAMPGLGPVRPRARLEAQRRHCYPPGASYCTRRTVTRLISPVTIYEEYESRCR